MPKISTPGKDLTIVASGHSSFLARKANQKLKEMNIYPEIIDVRILNPLHIDDIVKSVKKTRKLLVIDPGWISSGFSAELIAKVVENLDVNCLTSPPARIALVDAPAPISSSLENEYYTSVEDIIVVVKKLRNIR